MPPKGQSIKTETNTVGYITFRDTTPRERHGRGSQKTPFENFEDLTTKLLRVPKEEVDQKRQEQERARKRR